MAPLGRHWIATAALLERHSSAAGAARGPTERHHGSAPESSLECPSAIAARRGGREAGEGRRRVAEEVRRRGLVESGGRAEREGGRESDGGIRESGGVVRGRGSAMGGRRKSGSGVPEECGRSEGGGWGAEGREGEGMAEAAEGGGRAATREGGGSRPLLQRRDRIRKGPDSSVQ